MRVLIAPDCFGGTLTAYEAADAIASGWRTRAPHDALHLRPLSDGGPGFVEVVGSRHGDDVYVESASVVGLRPDAPDPHASSAPFGLLLRDALATYPKRVYVGLGGTGVMDGGAGAQEVLDSWPADVELIMCTDVLVPLLGPTGAVYGFGPQKGATNEELPEFEERMRVRADELERRYGRDIRDEPGAGAAGGLGAWLIALGASVRSGLDVVAEAVGLDAAIAGSDLVITGEGKTDSGSLRGKVVGSVAGRAMAQGRPCVVISGQVEVGRREGAAHGMDETFSCAELAGSAEAAMAEARHWLEAAAAHAAGSWSPARA